MRRLHREVRALDEVLSLIRPRLVITPFGRRAFHALGELSQRRDIPGLLISHGSFTPVKDDLSEIAWAFHSYGMFHGSYSHAALQSPLAESYSQSLRSSSQFVRTGPLVWGAPVKRQASKALKAKIIGSHEDCRVVVHAGTTKARGGMHFHVYETPDEFVKALQDLVLAVNEVPNTRLIIKFRSPDLSEDELRALLPPSDCYSISVDEPFLDVLGFTDLLVSFASTTIEEALQNRVPVLLYGGEGRYQHVEAAEVTPDSDVEPSAVYAVRRSDYLVDALRRILDTNGNAPLPEELFRRYVYKPEETTAFPDLVRDLVGA